MKKIRYPALSVHDFYIGSVVNVNARQMKIIDFGNQHTKNIYSQGMEITLAMIKPDGIKNMGEIIDIIYSEGFRIAKMRMVQLSQKEAQQFYAVHEGKPFFHSLVAYMSSDKIVALELVSNNAVAKWRAVIGPTNCDAKRDAPNSIRARFGTDKTRNAVHGSDSRDNAIIVSMSNIFSYFREVTYTFFARNQISFSGNRLSYKSLPLFPTALLVL